MAANRCMVRPSVAADVYEMAANLRRGDRAEIEGLGGEPRLALRRTYRNGILRKTYLVDGELAAMSGLCGPMLADIGQPYLVTTPAAERVPVTFVKAAREAVTEMLVHRLRLEGHVAADYTGACRLLELLGFTLGKPEPFGPTGVLFRTFTLIRMDG